MPGGVAAPLRAGTSRAEAASREAPTASTSMSARSPDTPVQRPQRLRNGYGLRCTRETASETAAAATGRAADDHGTIRPLQHVAAVRRRDHDPTESAGRQRGGVHLAAVWRPRVSLHPTVTSNGSETPQKRLKFCSTSSSSPPPLPSPFGQLPQSLLSHLPPHASVVYTSRPGFSSIGTSAAASGPPADSSSSGRPFPAESETLMLQKVERKASREETPRFLASLSLEKVRKRRWTAQRTAVNRVTRRALSSSSTSSSSSPSPSPSPSSPSSTWSWSWS